jgi:hypothetical protein
VKYRVLAVMPLALALALALVQSLVSDPHELYRYEVLLMKGLAAIGSAAAGVRFLRRDYLRSAWLLTCASFSLLFVKDLVFGIGWRSMGSEFPISVAWTRGALTIAANVCGGIGALLLARAWQVAGLLLPGSRLARFGVLVAATVLALATAGAATLGDLRDVFAGYVQRIPFVASDLGDIVELIIIAPVLLTALALRGGLLAWPWTLMAASQIGWLLYDAAGTYGGEYADPKRLLAIEEVFRCLACLFAFSSGVAQRLVMTDLRAAGLRASRAERRAAG